MNASCHYETCELTIGDLIAAVTEAALEATDDEEKAHEIASSPVGSFSAGSPRTVDHRVG